MASPLTSTAVGVATRLCSPREVATLAWRRWRGSPALAGVMRYSVMQSAERRDGGHSRGGARGNVDDGNGSDGNAQAATPAEAYGDNAAFPKLLVGNFATRKPQSLSYFTGNSKLHDFLQSVSDYSDAAHKLTKYPEITYSLQNLHNYAFASPQTLERQFGIRLLPKDYNFVMRKVKGILCLSPLPPKFAHFAQHFLTEAIGKSTSFNPTPLLDEDGIAHSWGTRKNALVNCKMVEGTGEILYNGKTLLEVYPNRTGWRETIIQPLIATESLGKYNIWLDVDMTRGGPSGRSEAARLAVAHALALHRPELVNILNQLGWMKPDPRTRERKKAGQPKARKKKQWVKR